MGEKDVQSGIVVLILAVFFLFSGLEMLDFQLIDPQISTFFSFILVAVGVYLITRK